ncbi:DNA adenine methylase [soil metagenome]
MEDNKLSSILKWAGGKRRIAHFLSKFCPDVIERYFEPFLGGGSLFLYLAQTKPRFKAVLSDSNPDLINVYKCVRDDVSNLIAILEVHQSNYYENPNKYYYYMRDTYAPANAIQNAARLIFLNRTCYNGLYRVNKSGSFNVPHGTYFRPTICNNRRLNAFSEILQRSEAEIICDNYRNVIQRCQHGDVIYLDPPYFPLSKTAYFHDYTKEEFGHLEQITLAKEFSRLSKIGCTVLLSNSSSSFISDLYQDYNIMTISTTRQINCDASNRLKHQELLITNKKLISLRTPTNYAQKVSQM